MQTMLISSENVHDHLNIPKNNASAYVVFSAGACHGSSRDMVCNFGHEVAEMKAPEYYSTYQSKINVNTTQDAQMLQRKPFL